MKNAIFTATAVLAFIASAAVAPSASAAVIDLTFEGVGNGASVNNFYNGGTDSQGHSGTDYGIRFTSSSLGLVASSAGGSGNFSHTSSGDTVLFFSSGSAILDDVAGFSNGFSFYYAAGAVASVNVYSGLDKTGELLATVVLPRNYQSCGYCRFDPIGVTFAGIAHSVDFGGTSNNVAFDDITIGSASARANAVTAAVPEPESVLLVGLGLTALVATRRRRRA